MAEAREQKINKRFAGMACTLCGDALLLGEDGAICDACDSSHHAPCWRENEGCGKAGCINAPFKIPSLPAEEEDNVEPDMMRCPHCHKSIHNWKIVCPICGQITELNYERKFSPAARNAFLFSLAALLLPLIVQIIVASGSVTNPLIRHSTFAGIYFGYKAIEKGGIAKEIIRKDPRNYGRGLAIAAQIIGGISAVRLILGPLLTLLLL
ncbi:MAG TPA: RING finger protein [Pyrinomonadaceae bacterium]|jgi:Zn finger protein HypA/HybF involved in hydrogenase expression